MTREPAFGCFARSADGAVLACVVGQRGFNIGANLVALVFVADDPRRAPGAILLRDPQDEYPGDGSLRPEVTAQVDAALRGMVALDRGGAHVTATRSDATATPPIVVGGLTIAYTARPARPLGRAPAFHTTLWVRRGGASELLEEEDKVTPTVEAHAFAVGRSVVVEQLHGIADEGISGEFGAVWRCDPDRCTPVTAE